MTIATCNVCRDFSVPWGDHIGPALMESHFKEKHPEIVLRKALPSAGMVTPEDEDDAIRAQYGDPS